MLVEIYNNALQDSKLRSAMVDGLLAELKAGKEQREIAEKGLESVLSGLTEKYGEMNHGA
jgi:hypothetical protein